MEGPARVSLQPGQDLRVLVGAVVVENAMDQLAAGRHGGLDRVQEAEELLVAVPVHAAAQHGAIKHVQGANKVVVPWRSSSWVVVAHRPVESAAFDHRQPRLGAVEGPADASWHRPLQGWSRHLLRRLDPGLLVDGQDDRMPWRVEVEADDVAQLGGERRVFGELEGPHPVWPQMVRAPDPPHRAGADPGRRGHGARGPVGRLVRRRRGRQRDHAVDRGLRQGRAGGARVGSCRAAPRARPRA